MDKRTCEERIEEALEFGRSVRESLERIAVTLEKMHANNDEAKVIAERLNGR